MAGPAVLSALDPFRTAKFPVQLGESFARQPGSKRFSSVQYNYKPKQTGSRRTTTLTRSAGGPDEYDLYIRDDSDQEQVESAVRSASEYKYHGRQWSQPASCALIFDNENQTFVMERLDSTLSLNLVSTPQESNARKLEKQYSQLDVDERTSGEQDDGLLGDDSEAPDSSNPYDYRHFLSIGMNGMGIAETPIPSRAATPRAVSPGPGHSPQTQISEISKKRKQAEREPTSSRQEKKKVIPRVRLQRRASGIPKSEEVSTIAEDNGGLIIEMDDEKPRKKKSHPELRGRRPSAGPISLRAAASSISPGARPRVRAPLKITLDSGGDEESVDGDIDGPELSRPVTGPSPLNGAEQDDDEDAAELEAELEHAFESQEEEEQAALNRAGDAQATQNSDAESEEE